MDKITIKYSVLMNLLKTTWGEVKLDEARKMGKIDILDDVSGQKIGEISFKDSKGASLE